MTDAYDAVAAQAEQPDPTDEQATAELLDPDEVDEVDYPPEHYLGADEFGIRPAEEAVGESVRDRDARLQPEVHPHPVRSDEGIGQLVDPDTELGFTDDEKDLVATELDPDACEVAPAEESAMHIVEPG